MTEKRAGDRYAFFKANVELSARILRIVWGVLQSGKPYNEGKAFSALRRRRRESGSPGCPRRRSLGAGRPRGRPGMRHLRVSVRVHGPRRRSGETPG